LHKYIPGRFLQKSTAKSVYILDMRMENMDINQAFGLGNTNVFYGVFFAKIREKTGENDK